MDAAAEAAIGAGDDVLAPHQLGEAQDAVGDELGMLDHVGGVADDAGDQDLAGRQLHLAPHFPFVLVAHVAGLDRDRRRRVTSSSRSTMSSSGRSVVCGPCQLPQQM